MLQTTNQINIEKLVIQIFQISLKQLHQQLTNIVLVEKELRTSAGHNIRMAHGN